jgi:hypothetical protein
MNLPLGFGSLDFADWFRGLISAFVSGGSTAVVAGTGASVIDSDHFRFGGSNSTKLMVGLFLYAGIMAALNFLRTKPIPEFKTVTTIVQKTEQQDAAKVVSTVKETHVEPLDPPKP